MSDSSVRLSLSVMGIYPGTPDYDRAFRNAKVSKCQVHQGVSVCFDCPAFDGCKIAKEQLRDERDLAFESGLRAGEREAQLVRDLEAVAASVANTISPEKTGSGDPNG